MRNKSIVLGVLVIALAFVGLRSAQSDEAPHPVEVRPSTVKPFALPKQLDFAGEALPLSTADIREKLDREILVNSYWQSNNLLMLKRSSKYFPIIEPILAKNGIPDDFKYLALIESGLQNVVSPAGAAGYWQIMKSTGIENGLEINKEVDERYHIEKSTQVACDYLNEAYGRFGNWTLAAASYNMGMAGTARRLEEQGVGSYYDLLLNTETARYVYRIAAVKHIHENLEDFGYVYHQDQGYSFPEMDTIFVNVEVADWISWAKTQGITYKTLRTYNPWIQSQQLSNSTNKAYQIWVPSK
ncbi:MAG: lytic transglycosylase domain-containing protein [Bacteroidetes bacterium]|nr:lytic transglycosylase domain-containing protein [Bacteroidota bacterium]MDA0899249.1 lytic transglycosylase domain-containing protein [Bacteroidota bacterium]